MDKQTLLNADRMAYLRTIVFRSLPKRYLHLAEDLVQDAAIKCLDKIDMYDETKGNFKSWIYRVTQNHCFDVIRKMDRMKTMPLNIDIIVNHETKKFDELEKHKIRKAIRCLNKRDRELIMMKFYFDYSTKEICATLDIPERQIAVYYKRAKERLLSHYHKVA